ncbi:MAG TPA: formate dehydrogenase accessory sulfurtransferase FdhD [Roseiarcus sp.]|nr:formate dehydrogenase accessory sulfurtransferase FdhD [Roseiarcus sp.]
MPPNEGAASIEVEARSFSYDSGAVGPTLSRAIAVEAPVEFAVGGAPFAVMMATPSDLEDFAHGFLLTEGVVERPDDIRGIEISDSGEGWRIAVTLTGEKLQAHLARKRAIGGRTGCGLCGVEDLSQMPSPRRPIDRLPPIEPSAIGSALAELEKCQPLNALTRAAHAAAWCARDGRIMLVREDVGRHNALDKAIGALRRAGVGAESGFFVITSRCSFEMVAKAAIFGAGTLVSVSAPTSLALSRARDYGVSLIAVARADKALSFLSDRDEQSGGWAA